MNTELTIHLDNFKTTLQENESYVQKYTSRLNSILPEHQELTPEEDEVLTKFHLSAKTCLTKMNDSRAPYTRRMDEIKGMFTAQEASIKTLLDKCQKARDTSASIILKKERKENEKLQLKEYAESQLRSLYSNLITQDKDMLLKSLETMKDPKIHEDELLSLQPDLTNDVFNEMTSKIVLSSKYENDTDTIFKLAIEGKYDLLRPHYQSSINAHIKYVISLIPSYLDKGAEVIPEVVPPTPASVASAPVTVKKKGVREKLILSVDSDEGWLQVVQMYFRDNSGVDGKVTLDKMRKYCESVVNKTDERIDVGVTYTEDIKAGIVRK